MARLTAISSVASLWIFEITATDVMLDLLVLGTMLFLLHSWHARVILAGYAVRSWRWIELQWLR